MPDQVRDVLTSDVYAAAFNKVMSGVAPALLDDAERTALRQAKELTNTDGPGYPMPWPQDQNPRSDA